MLACGIAFVAICLPQAPRLVAFAEAESLEVRCAEGGKPGDNLWAAGGLFTPRFFGKAAGDRLTWRFDLAAPAETPTLLVRYAYDGPGYAAFAGYAPSRKWHIVVDGRAPVEVALDHTGGWDDYAIAPVKLPSLPSGSHFLQITNPNEHATADIDALGLVDGSSAPWPLPFRPTVLGKADSGRFLLRATARAEFRPDPKTIFAEFEKIYAFMKGFSAWEPTVAIGINVIEDKRWPFGSATAFSDMRGVFFRASVMHPAYGDWCHEMSHWFLVGRAPKWLEEPLVQVLTAMVWMPALYPGTDPKKDPLYAAGERMGREVLADQNKTYADIGPILYAIAVKYGPPVYGRFFKSCAKAGSEGRLDFRPGRHLSRDEIVDHLSVAAGQSVLPLLRRWTGFDDAR